MEDFGRILRKYLRKSLLENELWYVVQNVVRGLVDELLVFSTHRHAQSEYALE